MSASLVGAHRLWHLTGTMTNLIYKICHSDDWVAAQNAGAFAGVGIDVADGYIHFSTASQAQETARLHFNGRDGLVMLTVDTAALGDSLKWEPSRGGELFPHLYGPLALEAVRSVRAAPLDPDGIPQLGTLGDEAAP